ncbi:unnamed protein product, partial [Schistosoma turkestanicum]
MAGDFNTQVGRFSKKKKPLRAPLIDSKAKNIFQEQLEKQLGSHVVSATYPEAAWNDIKKAVISTSKVNHKVSKKPWISVAYTELMDARTLIPSSSENDEEL